MIALPHPCSNEELFFPHLEFVEFNNLEQDQFKSDCSSLIHFIKFSSFSSCLVALAMHLNQLMESELFLFYLMMLFHFSHVVNAYLLKSIFS